MNNIALIGRLVKDPEVKELNNDKKIANFMIAVDREYKDANGQKVTDFIPCNAWSPTANIIEQYFQKGTPIGITGRLESRSYTDNEGNKKTSYSVNVLRVDFIQSKGGSNNQHEAPAAPKKQIEVNNEYDEELPFRIDDDDESEPPF